MLHNRQYDHEDCRTLSEILGRIGDRWTILILGLLREGPVRFNEIRRTLEGISQRMLTLNLRALERDGLVVRTQYPTIPPAVDYALSTRGKSLLGPVILLAEWARSNRLDVEQSRAEFDRTQASANAATPSPGVYRLTTRTR